MYRWYSTQLENLLRVEQRYELPPVVTDIDLPSTTIEKVPLSIHTGTKSRFIVLVFCVLSVRGVVLVPLTGPLGWTGIGKELSITWPFLFLDVPPYGTVRTALPLSYTLFNKTATVQEIEAKVEQSEHFMFTGGKEVSCRDMHSRTQSPSYARAVPRLRRVLGARIDFSMNFITADSDGRFIIISLLGSF